MPDTAPPGTNSPKGELQKPISRVGRSLSAVSRLSLEHPIVVLLFAITLTVLSVMATMRLEISTDLKALLPEDYQSVTRLTTLKERLGGQTDLILEIRSPSPEANERFGNAIVPHLEARDDIRFTIFKRDKDVLERSVLLFLTMDKLRDLQERVKERIRREVRAQLSLDGGVNSAGGADDAKKDSGDDKQDDDEDIDWDNDSDDDDDDADDDEDVDWSDDTPKADKAVAAPGAPGPSKKTGDEWSDEDLSLDVGSLKERFKEYDVPEFLTADEGRIYVVKARPTFPTTEVAKVRALTASVNEEIARLDPASYHPEMEVRLEGHYADMTGKVDTMKDDIVSSSLVCLAILLSVVVAYFRRLRPLLLIFVPLLMSIFWSLGVAWIVYGGLNLISAFIFAILLGLGIDFGIHTVARYREELVQGRPWREAFLTTAGTTGVSVFTGGTTTAAVFFMLSIAHFRGFSQFGVVAGFGVLFSLLGMYTILPAVVALSERALPWNPTRRDRQTRARAPRPVFLWAISLVIAGTAIAYAGYGIAHIPDLQFEYDFSKLGKRKPITPKNVKKEADFRDAVGRVTTGAPAIVMAENPADAESVYRALAVLSETPREEQDRIFKTEKPEDLLDPAVRALVPRFGMDRVRLMADFLSKTLSIYTFVPTEQEAKLPILADIRRRLEQKKGLFKGKDREDLDEFLDHVATTPLTLAQLPRWILAQFSELDERVGTFIIVYTRGSKDSYINASQLKTALFNLETCDFNLGPPEGQAMETVPSAANYYVLADVIDTVKADAPVVFSWAFLVILILVSVQLRRVGDVLLVMLPLLMALAWLCAFLYQANMKLNFYNMVLLPLLIGMGVDAGVHIIGRYREEGRGSLGAVMKEAGGAIIVAASTTAIGFGGVYYAKHIGLESMGTLAIVGILLTMLSSVLALPTFLWLLERITEPDATVPDAKGPDVPEPDKHSDGE